MTDSGVASRRKIAVVLAGAVAKGAFTAGALEVLVRRDVEIVRIVAASSGALNGTVLAAGIRAGDPAGATDRMRHLWTNEATLRGVFRPDPWSILTGRGLSSQGRLLEQLRKHVRPAGEGRHPDIELTVLVSPLNGFDGAIDGRRATTYERPLRFGGTSFDREAELEEVFRAAVASGAFPVAFAPMDLGRDIGPSVDGGTVNNTPIKYALEGELGEQVESVVVISPTPLTYAPPAKPLRCVGLVAHLADMLINERLYRDLREACETNDALRKLDALRSTASIELSEEQLRAVKVAIGWERRRQVGIVEIRPERELEGNAFSGFTCRRLREQYLAEGARRARSEVASLPWAERTAG